VPSFGKETLASVKQFVWETNDMNSHSSEIAESLNIFVCREMNLPLDPSLLLKRIPESILLLGSNFLLSSSGQFKGRSFRSSSSSYFCLSTLFLRNYHQLLLDYPFDSSQSILFFGIFSFPFSRICIGLPCYRNVFPILLSKEASSFPLTVLIP